MTFGTFSVVIDGEQIGGLPETAARLTVDANTGTLKDSGGDKFKFPRPPASVALPYTLTLDTDVASGAGVNSTVIGYTVRVTTSGGGVVNSTFAARPAGTVVALTDLTETVVIPINETIAARDEAVAAAAAAVAVGSTNDTIIASRVNDVASATRAALSATYARKVQIVVDGSGAGDYATIAAALAAVPAAGADVLVKRGTYTMSPVNMPAKTTLRGEGPGTILKLANSANASFLNVGANVDDVTFQDLTVDGNRANQSADSNAVLTRAARTRVINCHVKDANGYNIVGFPGTSDFIVRGCISEGARDEGIEFQGVTRGSAVGNLVRNIGKNGIYVYANTTANAAYTCTDITIADNVVEGSAALSSGNCNIRVDDRAENVTVTGNVVVGGGSGCVGIMVSSASAYPTKGVTVTGNSIRNSPGIGIYIGKSEDTTVTGNSVRGAGASGISAGEAASAIGVVISGNNVVGSQRSGIFLYNLTNFVVTGNICRNNGVDQAQTNYYNGITLWNSSGTVDKGIIAHNRCFDDQGTKTQQYGIRTLNTIGASVIVGPNIVDGNGTSGQAFSFGGATAPSAPAWKLLPNVTVVTAGNNVPHGLPYVPTSILIFMRGTGIVRRAGNPDATNIVLASDVASTTCDVWVG